MSRKAPNIPGGEERKRCSYREFPQEIIQERQDKMRLETSLLDLKRGCREELFLQKKSKLLRLFAASPEGRSPFSGWNGL